MNESRGVKINGKFRLMSKVFVLLLVEFVPAGDSFTWTYRSTLFPVGFAFNSSNP